MSEDKLKNIDAIYGFVIVADSYDDPEIKKMWADFDKTWSDLADNMRRLERIEDIKFYFLCAFCYFFLILNVFFVAWIFK